MPTKQIQLISYVMFQKHTTPQLIGVAKNSSASILTGTTINKQPTSTSRTSSKNTYLGLATPNAIQNAHPTHGFPLNTTIINIPLWILTSHPSHLPSSKYFKIYGGIPILRNSHWFKKWWLPSIWLPQIEAPGHSPILITKCNIFWITPRLFSMHNSL